MQARRFTATFFIITIIFFMCLAIVSYIVQKTYYFMNRQEEVHTVENINWEKLYPFNDGSTAEYSIHSRTIVKYIYTFIKEKCKHYSSDGLIGYINIVEAAKKYEELIGWNIAPYDENTLAIKLHDGYLSGLNSSVDVSPHAEAVIDFADWCRSKGIGFFYVNAPYKVCISEDKDISGILDFSNQNADRFLGILGEAGIKTYDLRKILHQDGMKHHESFFITDHHWKPETGLWAAKHILGFLRDDYGWNVEPEILNPDKFEGIVYPEWFLGSQGKKLTLARIQPEDFTMIYPKYETLIHYEVPDKNINTTGDFSVMYSMYSVASRDYYGRTPYGAYGHGDRPLIRTHNYMNHNGKKLLTIHDSFADSVVPFLSMGIEYTAEIDLRYFTGSLKKYIAADTPDVIIIMYNTRYVAGVAELKNYNVIYDFR